MFDRERLLADDHEAALHAEAAPAGWPLDAAGQPCEDQGARRSSTRARLGLGRLAGRRRPASRADADPCGLGRGPAGLDRRGGLSAGPRARARSNRRAAARRRCPPGRRRRANAPPRPPCRCWSGTGCPRRAPRGGSPRRRAPGRARRWRVDDERRRRRSDDSRMVGSRPSSSAHARDLASPRGRARAGARRAARRREPVADARRAPSASSARRALSRSAIETSARAPRPARAPAAAARPPGAPWPCATPASRVDADDLAGRLHPRAERRVDARAAWRSRRRAP